MVKKSVSPYKEINGVKYEKNVTCFKIGTKWYAIDNPAIAYDNAKKCWALKANLTEGIINNKGEMGFFTPNLFSVLTPYGLYLNPNDCPYSLDKLAYEKSGGVTKKAVKHDIALAYSFSENKGYIQAIVKEYEKSIRKISTEAIKTAKYLKGYSFGIEYETSDGTIPGILLGDLGLVPLKDGSLRRSNGVEPYEYATVPMTGAKGLQSIADQAYFLENYCEYDSDCSLHLHIGNLRTDRPFVVALYKLCTILQGELYDMCAPYKRDPQYFLGSNLKNGDRRKNYARLLPGIPETSVNAFYREIFKLVSDGHEFSSDCHIGSSHPVDKKWNHNNRYYCVNFEHMFLGNAGTVEFRISEMSFDSARIINWLLICAAIVRYAETYTWEIMRDTAHPSLMQVVAQYANDFGTSSTNESKQKLASYLGEYVTGVKKANLTAIQLGHPTSFTYSQRSLVPSNFLTQLEIELSGAVLPKRALVVHSVSSDYNLIAAEWKKAVLGLGNFHAEIALANPAVPIQEEEEDEDDGELDMGFEEEEEDDFIPAGFFGGIKGKEDFKEPELQPI